ncbi:alpha/beta fold hydrolase [Novosphingobium album (ex Liu et al. 2023)]|uniref:Alpha/beta hydrolase n=1 Tax=Novosphingobium album (ex Liu et al. 2023) TaxID=3031130 RepID=A0ABT5WL73_9SPHN|nr:alpha/beta hydrolase [Novosphingobium album (ex Liu et al. 2023)]MDE8650796.1 alpha/beta hydrolase [Novosphingobium album (ex Liu et al. 2023)]
MAKIEVNGLELDYELIGDENAPPLVLTPGGRYPRDTAGVPELGQLLADGGYRVLLWDRPGCGASDIAFTAPSESVMNCEALVGLVQALGLRDIRVVGGSAGSRISLMAAARMPENVRKIAIWWISGGPVGLAGLAWFYCGDQIAAASKGGMEAVVQLPSWAEQIARNPRIRQILLAQDPDAYIDTMQRWGKAFAYSDESPVPGLGEADFARLAMPIMVLRSGKSDMAHTRRTSEWVHELLPNSTMVEPPWGDQEWNYVSTFPIDTANRRGRFERWPLLAPMLLDFLKD